MPDHGIMAIGFEIDEVDYVSPEAGGRMGGVTAGFPLWRLTANLQNMRLDDADIWIAFRDRLSGIKRPFLARDASRELPRHHPEGFRRMTTTAGAPFTGAAAAWSQTISADGDAVLTLAGLPRGLRLAHRDYIGFRWTAAGSAPGSNDRRTLVRVVEPAMANASGQIAVKVMPAVPTLVVPPGAVAHLDRPGCIMRQVTSETQMPQIGLGYVPAGGAIVAVQDLRP